MNRTIMALNWLALAVAAWMLAPVEVLRWLALAALLLHGVLRAGSIWLNATDPLTALDVLSLVGMAWAISVLWGAT